MNPFSIGRTRSHRRLLAVIALMCALLGLAVPNARAQTPDVAEQTPGAQAPEPSGTSAEDPRVTAARRQAEEARRRAQEAAAALQTARDQHATSKTALDEAVAAFEEVNSHHLRLLEESTAQERKVLAAEQATARMAEDVSDRISAVYKRPEIGLELASALLEASDAGTAVHRVELVQQLSSRGVERIHESEAQAVVTEETVRQHRVIKAGVSTSAEKLRRAADDLAVAMQAAQHRVEQAAAGAQSADEARAAREADVEAVEKTVNEERAAAARAAEEARQRAAAAGIVMGGAAGGPLPPVEGKVCPIGAPNGFIDSWGYPRSGGRQHQGVDMFAAYGMPLYAVADGSVRVTQNRLGGLSVHLTDDDGNRYYYAHLSAVAVSTGQRVTAGQVVGANGNSGNARTTPPHLHWQYHPGGGAPVNPFPLAQALCR